jgi:predicted site-specific integrase-resolvase
MDTESVAKYLGVDVKHIRLWTRLGVLPCCKGPPYRYDVEEIDTWVAEGNLEKHRPPPQTEFKHQAGFWVKQ